MSALLFSSEFVIEFVVTQMTFVARFSRAPHDYEATLSLSPCRHLPRCKTDRVHAMSMWQKKEGKKKSTKGEEKKGANSSSLSLPTGRSPAGSPLSACSCPHPTIESGVVAGIRKTAWLARSVSGRILGSSALV